MFSEYPEQKTPRINIDHFQKLERIPCASALIRLDYCTIDVNGRSISVDDANAKVAAEAYLPPPDYKKREYSTLFFPVTKSEKDLFEVRKNRQDDPHLRTAMQKVCKGLNVDGSDSNLAQFFADRLKEISEFRLLDLNFFSSYSPQMGFVFNLEEIRGIE